jgi:hypothetical protein
MELKISSCCGACKYSNKPKTPDETHAPHYTIAKTERWCFKHEVHTIREATCTDFEMETKKGAVPAYKRILTFNKKLSNIIRIKEWMQQNSIEVLYYYENDKPYTMFKILDNKIKSNSCKYNFTWETISSKQTHDYEQLLKAYEQYFSTEKKV